MNTKKELKGTIPMSKDHIERVNALIASSTEQVKAKFRQIASNYEQARIKIKSPDSLRVDSEAVSVEIAGFLRSRKRRAIELEQPLLKDIEAISKRIMGEDFVMFDYGCIDGRNPPALKIAKVPFHGGTSRTPAGIVQGFSGLETGSVAIEWESPIIEKIKKVFKKYLKGKGRVGIAFDSHLGCAAADLQNKDCNIQDNGRTKNLLAKIHLEKGMRIIVTKLIEEGELAPDALSRLTFIHYAYDSHIGTAVNCLDAVIDDPELISHGLTDTFISGASNDGNPRLLNNSDLLQIPNDQNILNQYIEPGSLDIRNNYLGTIHSVWKTLEALWDRGNSDFYQTLVKTITEIYVNNGWQVGQIDDSLNSTDKIISRYKIEVIAKVALRNLIMRWGVNGADGLHSDHNHHGSFEKEWPFANHTESCIVVTEAGYAPFESNDAFSVNAADESGLVDNVLLAETIVRANRTNQTIKSEHYKNVQDFVTAPVVVINKGIIKGLTPEAWAKLQKVDWTKMEAYFAANNYKVDPLQLLTELNITDSIVPNGADLIDTIREIASDLGRFFKNKNVLEKNPSVREKFDKGSLYLQGVLTNEKRMPMLTL